jgi:hypothetical protein
MAWASRFGSLPRRAFGTCGFASRRAIRSITRRRFASLRVVPLLCASRKAEPFLSLRTFGAYSLRSQ